MSSQMIIRIAPDLKSQVSRLAKSEGKSVSVLVRELLENYVKDRDIGSYIEDLWTRTGAILESRGIKHEDIQRIIKEVRSSK